MLTQGPNKIKWKKQEWNWRNETDSTKQFNPKKCKTVSFESKKKIQDCIIENLKMPEKYQAI